MEGKKIYLKATKYLKGDMFDTTNVNDFFKQAEEYSLNSDRNSNNQVFIREETIKTGLKTKRYAVYNSKKCPEASLVAKISSKDNPGNETEEVDNESITFTKLEDFEKLDLKKCVAYVVGKIGKAVVIEVEEKENEVKEAEESSQNLSTKSKDDIINAGILSESELNERIRYLKTEDIYETSPIFALYLDQIRKQPEGKNIKKPETVYRGVGSKNSATKKLISKMLVHVICGHKLILQGHKSTGKNVAWETIAWLFNCQLISLTCSKRMTSSDIFGHASTDNSLKEGISKEGASAYLAVTSNINNDGYKWMSEASEFVERVSKAMSPSLVLSPGQITKALLLANEGYGVILLLNEMNYSDPNTLASALNDIIDGHTDYMYITDMGNVPISNRLIVGATQNTLGGEYIGTQQQNGALMSRCDCIILDKASDITSLLKQANPIFPIPEEVYGTLNKIYGEFIDLVDSGQVSEGSLNVRGFKRAVESISLGYSISEAVEECVINTVQSSDEFEVLMEAVDNQITNQ